MELHNTSLQYAFPYQNMEFHITKILKEIIAQNCTPGRRSPLVRLFTLLQKPSLTSSREEITLVTLTFCSRLPYIYSYIYIYIYSYLTSLFQVTC